MANVLEWIKEYWAVLLLTAGIGLLFCAAILEERQWQKFKVEHRCRKTSVMRGQSYPVYSTDPNTGYMHTEIHHESDTVCWLCDDGVEYCR